MSFEPNYMCINQNINNLYSISPQTSTFREGSLINPNFTSQFQNININNNWKFSNPVKIDYPKNNEDAGNENENQSSTKINRHRYSIHEDEIICKEVLNYSSLNRQPDWEEIGKKISRTPRQARSRFYVIGSSVNELWTEDEIRKLLVEEQNYGSKMELIAKAFNYKKLPYQIKKKLLEKKLIEASAEKTKMIKYCHKWNRRYRPYNDDELIQKLMSNIPKMEKKREKNFNQLGYMAYCQFHNLNKTGNKPISDDPPQIETNNQIIPADSTVTPKMKNENPNPYSISSLLI